MWYAKIYNEMLGKESKHTFESAEKLAEFCGHLAKMKISANIGYEVD